MTTTGIILLGFFVALIGYVVGYNVARNKYNKPVNRAGGGGGGHTTGNETKKTH